MSEVIEVEVVKPFKETRTPCPPKGTRGELYDFDGEFACVRFPLPLVDTEGRVWESHFGEYMKLKFKLDEIAEVV